VKLKKPARHKIKNIFSNLNKDYAWMHICTTYSSVFFLNFDIVAEVTFLFFSEHIISKAR
jgi:hypothetical protein